VEDLVAEAFEEEEVVSEEAVFAAVVFAVVVDPVHILGHLVVRARQELEQVQAEVLIVIIPPIIDVGIIIGIVLIIGDDGIIDPGILDIIIDPGTIRRHIGEEG
jgi:hypothetical protein